MEKTFDALTQGIILILVGLTLAAGCKSLDQGRSSKDSKVDTQLSEPAPSLPAPAAAPGEPQPGFEQESPRSQNV